MRPTVRLAVCALLGVVLVATPARADAATPSPSATPTMVAAAPGALGVLPARLLVQPLIESQVLSLTNIKRRKKGCAPLRASTPLRRAARGHSVTMAKHRTMSHQLPGEPKFSVRITNAGYRDWWMVAENVARGFTGARSVVRAWMASPGHRANILNCRLRDLGVGVVLRHGQLWWTQNFGRQ